MLTEIELEAIAGARIRYENNYGTMSVCNNVEMQAILRRFNSTSDVLLNMRDRRGTPSPRSEVTFDRLPQGSYDASKDVDLWVLPDPKDTGKVNAYLCAKYRLNPDTDKWLLDKFREDYKTEYRP